LQVFFESLLAQLQEEGGDLANETETAARRKALCDDDKPAPTRPTKPCLAVSNTRPWQNAALLLKIGLPLAKTCRQLT